MVHGQGRPDDLVDDGRRRLVLALLATSLVTAVLAVVGPLQTLFESTALESDAFGNVVPAQKWHVTGWAFTVSLTGQPDHDVPSAPYGLVLGLGAFVLMAGAARATIRARRAVAGCLAVAGAAGVLVGLLEVVLQYRAFAANFAGFGSDLVASVSFGSGGWLVLLAGATAMVAAALAVRLVALTVQDAAAPAPDMEDAEPVPGDEPVADGGPPPDERVEEAAVEVCEPSPWDSEPGWQHRPASVYQRRA